MEGKLLIAYPEAMKILRSKWGATKYDIMMWVSKGAEFGGLDAFLYGENYIGYPPRFYYNTCIADDFKSLSYCADELAQCWFGRKEIDNFTPADRFITFQELCRRWSGPLNTSRPEVFIYAKIRETLLLDQHPTFAGTIEGFAIEGLVSELNKNVIPPTTESIFSLKEVKLIEYENGFVVLEELGDSFDSVQTIDSQDATTNYKETLLSIDEAIAAAGFKARTTFLGGKESYNKAATKSKHPTIEPVLVNGKRKTHYRRGDCIKLKDFCKNNRGLSVKRITNV